MLLTHDLGRMIELRDPKLELPLWRYVYGGKPKPFFHPLCTPAGHCLTLFEPHDHTWHRGLWYTLKYVNGENFWEEKAGEVFGTQQTVSPPDVTHGTADSIRVASRQLWQRPRGAGAIFDETRVFAWRPLTDQAYAIDFATQLTPLADVLLDRTPFTTWGGYSGFTFRGNRNWQQTKLTFADGSTSDRPTPYPSPWCDLTGKIDGADNHSAGVAMFDHPSNPRHPTPWYGGTGPGHYYNAAFIFNETMTLKAGHALTQRYRVLVHDGAWPVDALNAEYRKWVDSGDDVLAE
jgi:hypothetical protein